MMIKGPNGQYVKVTDENMLRVCAQIEYEVSHVSEAHGQAYVWTATADWGADKNALWLRNDSLTDNLVIEQIIATMGAAAVVEIWVGSGNTAAGTAVTGICLNRGLDNTALATCKHTNTNVDTGTGMTLLLTVHLPVTNAQPINFFNALILDYYDEVAVNIVTDVASSSVNILGYFHSPE